MVRFLFIGYFLFAVMFGALAHYHGRIASLERAVWGNQRVIKELVDALGNAYKNQDILEAKLNKRRKNGIKEIRREAVNVHSGERPEEG